MTFNFYDLLITIQAYAAARGTQKRRTSEPHAAESEEIFAAYRPWHLPFTRSPCSREACL